MMMLSTSTQTCNASSSEALLEVILFDSTRPSSSAMVAPHGGVRVSVVVPSDGTFVDSFRFRHGEPIANLTACLSRSICYGVEIVSARKGSYQVIYDGQKVMANAIQFPYYVTHDVTATSMGTVGNSSSAVATMTITTTTDDSDDSDDSTFKPYESNLTFVELILSGGGEGTTACVPKCHSDNETLHEVVTYGGKYGDGALGWRIQDEQGRSLMGCQDEGGGGSASSTSGGRCGTMNGVRVARACLPRIQGCRQFVMGHPQQVPSEGSMAAAPGDFSGGGNSSANGNGEHEAGNRWVGHYHPSYRVSVDGNVVAEGSSVTFASAELDGGDGGGCSRCSPNETLLEIFQYQTVPLHYTLRDVQADQLLVSAPSGFGNSSLNHVLRYDRRCIPSSKCYDLAFSRAASSDDSSSSGLGDSDGVSTKVVLGGAHFANTMVRELPFQLILGEQCDRRVACQLNESLVRVDIRTNGSPQNESQHIPGYYLAWSLFDANHPPPSRMPEVSTTYFSNGYPGGGRYVHYQCVTCPADPLSEASSLPSSSSKVTSFGMLNSVSPDDVSWSLERNGVILGCREHGSASPHPFLNDFILTPLDGSCWPPFSSDHSSHSSGPPPEAMMTCFRIVVGIVVGIAAMVGLLGVAVFYAGAGGDEAEIAGSAGGGAGRRWSSSTGTVCEDESVGSVEEAGSP